MSTMHICFFILGYLRCIYFVVAIYWKVLDDTRFCLMCFSLFMITNHTMFYVFQICVYFGIFGYFLFVFYLFFFEIFENTEHRRTYHTACVLIMIINCNRNEQSTVGYSQDFTKISTQRSTYHNHVYRLHFFEEWNL